MSEEFENDESEENTETEKEDCPVDDRFCNERHKRVDQRIGWLERDITSIKHQITATFVFVIVTLVTVLIEIFARGH